MLELLSSLVSEHPVYVASWMVVGAFIVLIRNVRFYFPVYAGLILLLVFIVVQHVFSMPSWAVYFSFIPVLVVLGFIVVSLPSLLFACLPSSMREKSSQKFATVFHWYCDKDVESSRSWLQNLARRKREHYLLEKEKDKQYWEDLIAEANVSWKRLYGDECRERDRSSR